MELKYPVITISREYAAGGRSIAKGLSEMLGIPFYDRDFVLETAKKTGYSVEEVTEEGESMSHSDKIWNSLFNLSSGSLHQSSYDEIFKAQKEVVLELAKSPCIIVGRCADYILTEAGIPAFKIFLFADEEHRLARAMELDESDDEAEVRKHLAKIDENRRTYYLQYTGKELGSHAYYNIALDTGTIGKQRCVELLCSLLAD